MATTRQANFTLPKDLLAELKRTVPRGELSRVVGDALRTELKRIKFRRTLDRVFGAWKAERHPELARGSRQFIRSLRRGPRTRRLLRRG